MGRTAIQTAFKFEPSMTVSMKKRARALGKSVSGYVRDLIEKDISESEMLPEVSIDDIRDVNIERLSGVLAEPDVNAINADPRASEIWYR